MEIAITDWGKSIKGGREDKIMARVDAAIASIDRMSMVYAKLQQQNHALTMEVKALKRALRTTLDKIGPERMSDMRKRRKGTWNRVRTLRRTKSSPSLSVPSIIKENTADEKD